MKKIELGLNEFRDFMRDKKCICFGAGLQGVRFINIFDNWEKADDIIVFADNDSKKWGSKIEYDHFSYPIVPIEDIFSFLRQDVVIIITCIDFISIRLQLEQYRELENIFCFSLVELGQKQLLQSDYDSVVHEYTSAVIPKAIHYCWFGGKMPEKLRENIDRWKMLCPDYEIKEWNESNYKVSKSRYAQQAYDMKKWGYVSDYARLDLIYQYGGIYLDTDVEMLKRPDDLLYQDGFACFDSTLLMNSGAGFGARKGNYIVKQLRDHYDSMDFSSSDSCINRIPCMTHSYEVLKRYGFRINDSLQKVRDMNIYPMIFQGTCPYTKQMKITDKTFFLHYGTTTWFNEKNKQIKDMIGKIYAIREEKGLESYNF